MKRNKGLKIFSIILGCIVAFFIIVNVIPPKKVIEENPFIVGEGELPMLAAHRGGSINNPENTLKAYKFSVKETKIDIVESDLWLTKDGKLVYNHDETIDRTSDATIRLGKENNYISDFTLEELKEFNFGYNFKDAEGNYPYRNLEGLDGANRKQILADNDLQIVEIDELFREFYTTNPDLLFILEIKNSGEKGFTAADIIDRVLTEEYPNYKDRVVIGTFHTEIEEYLKENHPTIHRGASTGGARNFILTHMMGVNIFNKGSFTCLQIPTSYDVGITLNLDKKGIIKRAHKRNIAVQYWTINDEETMRDLVKLGSDAIMTDDPVLLREVLESYK